MSEPVTDTHGVYLLHFDSPVGSAKHSARHYIGYADNIARRIQRHRAGSDACLMAECKRQGISFTVVRTWPGMDRNGERNLKKRRNHKHLCPICRASAKETP